MSLVPVVTIDTRKRQPRARRAFLRWLDRRPHISDRLFWRISDLLVPAPVARTRRLRAAEKVDYQVCPGAEFGRPVWIRATLYMFDQAERCGVPRRIGGQLGLEQ